MGAVSAAMLTQLPSPPAGRIGWPWTELTPDPTDLLQLSSLPRISITIPSYNQAAYLEESLRSILLQNYPNQEVFVMDGGSSDASCEIIERYSPWLTEWISEPDRGQSHAINKGFARSTGDLITFLSSDDTYLPGTFWELARLWPQAQNYGAIIGAFQFQDSASNLQGEAILPLLTVRTPFDLTLGPPGIYRLHQVGTFYTRIALDQVGRYTREDMKFVMDRELLYRVCKAFPLFLTNRPLGAFRKHSESKSLASILPFAEEFSRLYLLDVAGNAAAERRRRRMANYRRSRGYLKYADSADSLLTAITALVQAAFFDSSLLLHRTFFRIGTKAVRRVVFHTNAD